MKQRVFMFVALLIVLVGLLYYQMNKTPEAQHIHAGFQVYIDGKLQDYSGIEFMSIKPCEKEHKALTKEEIQDEKAHLHDGVGDVVHSHFKGARWGDLFKNIKVTFDPSKEMTGYINGKKIEDIMNHELASYDSMVLFVGNVDTSKLKNAVTISKIKNIEKKSESCGVE